MLVQMPGVVIVLGVPGISVVLAQVVVPAENVQPGWSADAGSPPVAARAAPGSNKTLPSNTMGAANWASRFLMMTS